MTQGALQGLTVLDLSHYLAGPTVAMILGDLGADVIRVDPPGGPRWQHPSNAILQRGKKSIVLDLEQPDDRRVAKELAARADVLVESFRPGRARRFGLDGATTCARNPRLIHLSLPGFAPDDPRADLPAWEGVLSAAAGLYLYPGCSPMDYVGDRSAEPIYNAIPLTSAMGVMVGLHSVAAALYARERSGRGQHIDTSLYEAAFELIGASVMRSPTRAAPTGPNPGKALVDAPQLGHYQGSDGEWLELCLFQDKHLEWFGREFLPDEWVADGMADAERMLTDPALRQRARERFTQLFATKPAREWEKLINDASGASAAICQSTRDWLRLDEDARANRSVIELTDPHLGATAQAGYPIKLSETPLSVQGPRHLLDSDRDAVLARLSEEPEQQPQEGPEPALRRALEGIRVLDTSQVLAGPTTSRILAEYGAEVVKVHSFEDRQLGMHTYTNSGKRSVMLNIKTPGGRKVFDRLATGIDVFVQNFSRGVAERIGMGLDHLRSLSPGVVYASVSAFGYDGYRGGWRGREQLGQAVTGMQVRFSGPGNEPHMGPFAYCDYSTGNFAAFGVIIALYHRLRTGQPQSVHASLSATGSFLQLPFLLDYEGATHDEPAGPEAKGNGPVDRLYRAADRWLYLAARPEQSAAVAKALGAGGTGPRDNEAALSERLATRIAGLRVAEVAHALRGLDVGVHALEDLDALMDADYAIKKGLVITRHHPGVGDITVAGPSARLTSTPVRPTEPVGPPGSDTRAVLTDLGLGAEVDDLIHADAVREGLPAGSSFIGLFR